MVELTEQEAKDIVNRISPSLGHDFTYAPLYPEGRKDVCAVIRAVEDGYSYGYSILYLVSRKTEGVTMSRELCNTVYSKDYINLKSIEASKDGEVTITYGSGGSYSGEAWEKTETIKI